MPLDGQQSIDTGNNVLYIYDGLTQAYREIKALNAADTFDVGGILTVEGESHLKGNVAVGGHTSPDNELHVMRSDASGTSNAAAVMTLERNNSTFLQILSNPANSGGILFGDNAAEASGEISYDHSDDSMHFFTAAAERVIIDSTGVGIGQAPAFGRRLEVSDSQALVLSMYNSETGATTNTDLSFFGTESDGGAEGIVTLRAVAHTKTTTRAAGDLAILTNDGSAGAPAETARFTADGLGLNVTSLISGAILHADGGLIITDTGAADGFGFERAGVAHAVLQEGVTGTDEVSLINPLNNDLRLGANGAARWFIEAAGHFNPQANNTYDIGTVTTNEVRDLYIVNAPTVSSNVLNKRMTEPLNIPLMAKLFQALEPIAYADYRDPTVTKWSFPAQAVEKTLDELGLDSSKISFLNHDKLTGGYGLRQGELIAPLVGVVGNHESRIAALEAA